MTFAHRVEDVVQVVEAIGVAALVLGGFVVLVRAAGMALRPDARAPMPTGSAGATSDGSSCWDLRS